MSSTANQRGAGVIILIQVTRKVSKCTGRGQNRYTACCTLWTNQHFSQFDVLPLVSPDRGGRSFALRLVTQKKRRKAFKEALEREKKKKRKKKGRTEAARYLDR